VTKRQIKQLDDSLYRGTENMRRLKYLGLSVRSATEHSIVDIVIPA
jgi:hypothetical protein